jgi:8-oxo-dGTP diphosphatase
LSEEKASRSRVAGIVQPLLRRSKRTVICTHRPVLPYVLEALGLPQMRLETSQLIVVHRRNGQVLGFELLFP